MDPKMKPDAEALHWSSRLRSRAVGKAASETIGENRRWAIRRHSGMAGFVYVADREAAIKVTVMDTSSSGARLRLLPGEEGQTVDDIPERLRLVLRNNREQTDVECVVVRRYADALGVRYVSRFNTILLKRPSYIAAAGRKR